MNHHRMFWEPNSILLQEYYGLLTAEPPRIPSVFPFENDLFTDILGDSCASPRRDGQTQGAQKVAQTYT